MRINKENLNEMINHVFNIFKNKIDEILNILKKPKSIDLERKKENNKTVIVLNNGKKLKIKNSDNTALEMFKKYI